MLTFVLKKSWEFRAQDFDSAKEIAAKLEVMAPEEMIETWNELMADEESLISHWERTSA